MTHEQKPESAEFRTREAQVARMCQLFHFPDADALNVTSASIITRNILEAEARGAAEQRRKDEPEFEKIIAERDEAEDFIRKMAETVLGEEVEWSNVYGFQNALNDVSERIFFLEKDTANVTALEARVKELEGENKAWSDAAANALTWLENGRQANARDELKAAQRRAAALSEGDQL
ncbi:MULTISPECIES: hypothetical protein [Asaia]|uniref:Ead/Ea22-like family protein n=1 Tax=Asaia bogorensis TaxID=91915 RepID=A0A060QF97_9PROT|nr:MULTISPECIES: hypothetical protein [Asaia]ETD00090.1 hypothetical protein P792_00620 [Asaia sp. SF2.1]CDG39590.1 hypothetical protein ASAP_1545 [Asaia bogorensis]